MTEPVWTGPSDARRRPGSATPAPGTSPFPAVSGRPGAQPDGLPGPRMGGPIAGAGVGGADPYPNPDPDHAPAGGPYPGPDPYPNPAGDTAAHQQGDPHPMQESYPNPDPYLASGPRNDPSAGAYPSSSSSVGPPGPAAGYGDPAPHQGDYPGPGPSVTPGGGEGEHEPWLGASMPPTRRRRGERAGQGENSDDSAAARLMRRPRGSTSRPQPPLQAAVGAVTEVVVVLAMALALSLLIKTFLVQAFFIPSQSMEDTLLVGDRVLVSKLTPGPFALHRGDVIVFKDPGGWLEPTPAPQDGPVRSWLRDGLTFVGLLPQDSGEHLIKRVIGLPGDTVTCCDAKGRLQVNGVSVNETYVRAGNVPSLERFTVTVQPGHLWVMGDNRSESADSRFHRAIDDGQVPLSDVVGKAFVIVWPLPRFGGVVEPPGVFSAVPTATHR